MPSDLDTRIEKHDDLGASHFLLTLSPEATMPSWQPGQFAMITLGTSHTSVDPLLRRPFSIFNLPGSPTGEIQIFYKVLGRGTHLLSQARPGDRIKCLAPLGNGFDPARPSGARLLLVAGGIGSASLHPLALQEARGGGSPLVLYGCRTADEQAGIQPTRDAGIETMVSTDDGSAGHHGFVSDLLDGFLRQEGSGASRRWVVCACGPAPMMKATAEVAHRHGVTCHVSLESPMACGFGVCVGCVVATREAPGEPVHYRRICMEGPVFDASKVCW